MSPDLAKQTFLVAADDWVCDDYALDIRYLAEANKSGWQILQASIGLSPVKGKSDLGFKIHTSQFRLGQVTRFPVAKGELIELLQLAAEGVVDLPDGRMRLFSERPLDYYSEMALRERWFSELHLQVFGEQTQGTSPLDLAAIDGVLRSSVPPFDGLSEAASWLGFAAPGTSSGRPSINIRILPPCDLIFEKCTLLGDNLSLALLAHSKFDGARVGLAVRAAPGKGLDGRKQISQKIRWGRVRAGLRSGTARLKLKDADSVLAMLMIGRSTVRRQWFLDPTKARNNRLLAVQYFDSELRQIRSAVLDAPESSKFEQGVAALLFLLGFSPCIQVEKDAPDLIVTTPGGRLVIVECTTRIADFQAKVGKLVDRRGALMKALTASSHPSNVAAALVCRLPRDQIAAHAKELVAHNILLYAAEDLTSAFSRVRHSNDPDQMLEEALTGLSSILQLDR